MQSYIVMVKGENFLLELEGVAAKYGFYTFRYVEASSPAEAEKLGIETVWRDVRERLGDSAKDLAGDGPSIGLEHVHVIESGSDSVPPGFVWYEMNPKRWWQFWRR